MREARLRWKKKTNPEKFWTPQISEFGEHGEDLHPTVSHNHNTYKVWRMKQYRKKVWCKYLKGIKNIISVLLPFISHITGSNVKSLWRPGSRGKTETSKQKHTFNDHLTQINMFKLQNSSMKQVLLLFPYYKWGTWKVE